jgi:hypothetical protein
LGSLLTLGAATFLARLAARAPAALAIFLHFSHSLGVLAVVFEENLVPILFFFFKVVGGVGRLLFANVLDATKFLFIHNFLTMFLHFLQFIE